MRALILFAFAMLCALYTADKLCFDGEYSAKIWKMGNVYGADWQKEARVWFKQHGY
jgi:hypothetical protein